MLHVKSQQKRNVKNIVCMHYFWGLNTLYSFLKYKQSVQRNDLGGWGDVFSCIMHILLKIFLLSKGYRTKYSNLKLCKTTVMRKKSL